jgi:hypothetical protein
LRCTVLRFLIFGGVGQIGAKLSSVFDRTVLTLQSFFIFYLKQGSSEARDPQQEKKHATITACQAGIRPRPAFYTPPRTRTPAQTLLRVESLLAWVKSDHQAEKSIQIVGHASSEQASPLLRQARPNRTQKT